LLSFFCYFYYCKLANTKLHKTRDRNSTKWSDGKTKKGWKQFYPQNKLIHDPEGNEENGYPIPDTNKTKIIYAKEPNEAHKNIMKEEILQVITENFMEMLVDMVNQNIQEALNKLQDKKK
jgi:hypothetical protein